MNTEPIEVIQGILEPEDIPETPEAKLLRQQEILRKVREQGLKDAIKLVETTLADPELSEGLRRSWGAALVRLKKDLLDTAGVIETPSLVSDLSE